MNEYCEFIRFCSFLPKYSKVSVSVVSLIRLGYVLFLAPLNIIYCTFWQLNHVPEHMDLGNSV